MEKILIVDDERGIRMVLGGMLQSSGYHVEAVESAEAAVQRLAGELYDLLLVDLQMAEMDGLELIERVKARHPQTAIIILTGYPTINTAIHALREGVDDYLIKPASSGAIRAAVRRALDQRRAALEQSRALERISQDLQKLVNSTSAPAQPVEPESTLRCGPLLLDAGKHRAEWFGRTLTLTPVQFRLLVQLSRSAGEVLAPQQLVAAVQGYECSAQEARELVKPHIYALRTAMEDDPAHPRYLLNVRGVGYSLSLPT